MVTIALHHDTTTSGYRQEPDREEPDGPAAMALHPIRAIARNYTGVHTTLGLIGNAAFLLGSVFFLFEALKTAGTWLFIAGATGMLVGQIGRSLVNWEDAES